MKGGIDISMAVLFYNKRLDRLREQRRALRRHLFWLQFRRLFSL